MSISLFPDKDGQTYGEVKQHKFAVAVAGDVHTGTFQLGHYALDVELVDKR